MAKSETTMKPMLMLFVSLLAVLGSTVWLAFIDAGVQAGADAHPDIKAMRVGVAGADRYHIVKLPAMIMQFGSLSVLGSLMALSLKAHLHNKWLLVSLIGIMVLSFVVWFQINASYEAYLESGEVPYLLGFPVPTSWAVYGVWIAGLLYTALYVLGFDRFVYSDCDQVKFEALLADIKDNRLN